MPPPSLLSSLLGRERRESEKEDSDLIYTRLFKSPREFLAESQFVIRASDNSAAMLILILLFSLSSFRQRCRSRAAEAAAAGCRKVSRG